MARLQELQYTVSGGTKVISGVSLSPRSTRGYLRTSLRCKQESARYTWIWIVFDLIMCKIFSYFLCFHHFCISNAQMGFLCVSHWFEGSRMLPLRNLQWGSFQLTQEVSLSLSLCEQIGEMGLMGFFFFLLTQTLFGLFWTEEKEKENVCFYLGPICNKNSCDMISFICFFNVFL